jgi:curli biogenesis system outer membrane secretion channel CsgG
VKIFRAGVFNFLMVIFLLALGSFTVHADDDWEEDWAESRYDGPTTPSEVQNIPDSVIPSPTTSSTVKKNQPPKIKKAQFRKTIAITRFKNRTTAAGQINLGSGMTDQLTNALVVSDNFVLLERESISNVLNEQDFARGNRTQRSTVAQTGRVVPAQILIKGAITEFQLEESGSGVGLSYQGFSLGNESSQSHVALILTIIDTTSGQVIDSVRLEGKAKGTGYKFGISYMGIGVDANKFDNTALGKSVQIVIDRAVEAIAKKLNQIPFEGNIITTVGDSYYTNIGSRNNVLGGDVFDVYAPGRELFDPNTGEKLGSLKKKVGMLVVSSPEEKYSKAYALNGLVFKEGYILKERHKKAKNASLR